MNWLARLFGKTKTDAAPAPIPAPPVAPTVAPVIAEPADVGATLTPATPLVQMPPPVVVSPPEPAPEPEPDDRRVEPSLEPERAEPADAEAGTSEADAEDDEDEASDDLDDGDPTIGRYEPLDDTALGGADLASKRAEAEQLALSGPHKVGPADGAGPGSLLEALMRLESEGRVISRVCDDAEVGFYILYEPSPSKA